MSTKKSAGPKTRDSESSQSTIKDTKSTGDSLSSDTTCTRRRPVKANCITGSDSRLPCLHCLRRIHTTHKEGVKRLDVLTYCKQDPSSTGRCRPCKDAHRTQSECVPVPAAFRQQAQILLHDALEYFEEKQEVDSALKAKSKQFHSEVTEALTTTSSTDEQSFLDMQV